MSNEFSLKIPDGMLGSMINTAIANALHEQMGPAIIEKLVMEVLTAKRSSYGKETFIGHAVQEAIREEAQHALREWIEHNRQDLRIVLNRVFDSRKELLINRLVDGLANSSLNVDISRVTLAIGER